MARAQKQTRAHVRRPRGLLPWPQPLQALAEAVVQEEIQSLHALIQALLQRHRRGAATQKT